MRNILIVDDNRANILILKAILNSFQDKNVDFAFSILEAEHGLEAVDICKREKIDLVFMDIMMPIMDGIEATHKIKEFDKKIMIVAVSALDDETNKTKILNNGAEDYIVKPISAEVFKKRLVQYLALINTRYEKKFSTDVINLFSNSIYSRRMIFFINNEVALGEFWDYFLNTENKICEGITELIRVLYGIGVWQLKLKFKFNIFVEEGRYDLYFTMNNMKLLNLELVNKIVNKNFSQSEFLIDDDKLSITIPKFEAISGEIEERDIGNKENINQKQEKDENHFSEEMELKVFRFLDGDDLEELEYTVNDLNSLMLLVGGSKLEPSEIIDISGYIAKVSGILSHYSETYNLYISLNNLSKDIKDNVDSFIEKSSMIGSLCVAFNNDLLTWIKKIFYEGAPSLTFMDSSIISNASMISGFIKPTQILETQNIDDIFDF